jgi:hypothetical protein
MGCDAGIEEFRVTGNKSKRIIGTLEPAMSAHRLVVDPKVIRQEETQRQLTRITEVKGSLKHDDRVDVLASSVSYWEDALGINVDDKIAEAEYMRNEEIIQNWENDDRRIRSIGYDRCIGRVEVNGQHLKMQKPSYFNNRLLRKFNQ